MSHKRRQDEERFAMAVLVSNHILREIRHNTPPSMTQISEQFDVSRDTIIRWLNIWLETCTDHKEMTETLDKVAGLAQENGLNLSQLVNGLLTEALKENNTIRQAISTAETKWRASQASSSSTTETSPESSSTPTQSKK